MNRRFNLLLKPLLLFLLGLCLSGCAAIPTTDEELSKMGEEVSRNMVAEYGVYRDEKVVSYCNGVGKRVEAGSSYQGEPIKFTVLDTPVVNAFSVPGGHIFVTRGLLSRVNSESELAFVLGHEIGHLTARHSAKRVSEIRTSNIFSSLLGTFIGMYSKDYQLGNLVSNIIDFSSIIVILNYGREAEFEADTLGLKYAYDSNYNPETADKFLSTLSLMEKSKKDEAAVADLFATHPDTEDRVKRVEDEAGELMAASTPEARSLDVKRGAFLERMDGLVLGESLDSGFITKEVYYNKRYMFTMKKPDGWRMQNARSYLVAVYQDRNNVFFTYASIESSSGLLDSYATSFLRRAYDDEKFDPKFKTASFLDVSALEFYRSKGRDVRAIFFRKGSAYYSLVYSYAAASFNDYDSAFKSLRSNFSFMTDEVAKGITEDTMRIYRARPVDTWADLSVKFYGDPKYKDKLMGYNGAVGEVRPGDQLKIPASKYLD